MAKINPIGIGIFRGAPTQADIVEFSNLLLQFENQRSRSKIVCGFFIILILEGIMF